MALPLQSDLDRLLAEEQFVRQLACDLAAPDADEVVQQTYLLALKSGGHGVRQPRSWLAQITRRVISNDRRTARRRAQRERAAAVTERLPSSADLAEREERRRALVRAVDALPEPLRSVVLLRYYEALPPRDIARALEIPTHTVHNRLRRAQEHLRDQLDTTHHGKRRAWLLPLLAPIVGPRPPHAALPSAAAPAGLAALGALTMTTTIKLLGGAAVVAAALIAWRAFTTTPSPATPAPTETARAAPLTADAPRGPAAPASRTPAASVAASPVELAESDPGASQPTAGALDVHVIYAEDGAPAADVLVVFQAHGGGGDPTRHRHRARTNAAGAALFTSLPQGKGIAWTGLHVGSDFLGVEIEAGVTRELTVELPRELRIEGTVVDHDGVGVASADVYLAPLGRADQSLARVAATDDRGRFIIRTAPNICSVGARADGFAASRLFGVVGSTGGTKEVRLVLPGLGGAAKVQVLSVDGTPIADAVVRIGEGRVNGIAVSEGEMGPFPAQVRTDPSGQARLRGLTEGKHPMWVRAPHLASWRGAVTVAEAGETSLSVVLTAGAACEGRVVDGAGQPLRDVAVEVGAWRDLAHFLRYTDADGTFRLDGLPAGEVEIRADGGPLGKASATIRTVGGATVRWAPTLRRGRVLQGKVLTHAGEPVAEAIVRAAHESQPGQRRGFASVITTDDGSFQLANCPAGLIDLTVRGQDIETVRQAVQPGANTVVVHAERVLRNARIVGTVVDPHGRAVAHADVSARRDTGESPGGVHLTNPATGAFALEGLPPGRYRISVTIDGVQQLRTEFHLLTAAQTLDLGPLQVP
ncbi:MAG: sigma-70 family RNA polymerase sigma factor [Planctomycetota bacterium]